MKFVVKKSIKTKIDEKIDELQSAGVEIVRIELSREEFTEFLENIQPFLDHDLDNVFYENGWCKKVKSGSYIMYRGICIQYHHSYLDGDKGTEFI